MSKYNKEVPFISSAEITLAKEYAEHLDNTIYYHKDQHGNSHWKKVARLKALKELQETFKGYDIMFHPSGVIIDDKWIVTLGSKKWRVDGRPKWYRLKNYQDFKIQKRERSILCFVGCLATSLRHVPLLAACLMTVASSTTLIKKCTGTELNHRIMLTV